MDSRFVPALLFCTALSAAAQAGPPASEDPFPFPLIPLMETVDRGIVSWRPDWPPELPPDAFSLAVNVRTVPPVVPGREGIRSVSLSTEPELRVARDAEGRFREFPHFWKGAFYRTKVRYDAGGKLRGLSLTGLAPEDGMAEGPALDFELELPGGDGAPFMVRSGDRVFWIVVAGGVEGMDGGGDTVSETWYDGEGNFFGLVTCRFAGNGGAERMDGGAGGHIVSLEIRDRWTESYRYYSGGALTRVESPGGVYTAVYGEKGPLYRKYTPVSAPAAASAAAETGESSEPAPSTPAAERSRHGDGVKDPADYPSFPPETDFQWDERGFLVLLRNRDADGAFAGEFRYEYETDDRGNWTLRREIEMVHQSGLLVPVFRGELRRRITRAEAGE